MKTTQDFKSRASIEENSVILITTRPAISLGNDCEKKIQISSKI